MLSFWGSDAKPSKADIDKKAEAAKEQAKKNHGKVTIDYQKGEVTSEQRVTDALGSYTKKRTH